MDKIVKTTFKGRCLYLNFSLEVMFDLIEKYGSVPAAIDKIEEDKPESVLVLNDIVRRLAIDGELCRRSYGYDHGEILEEDIIPDLRDCYPFEYVELKDAVMKAFMGGYNRETRDEASEVDTGLQKLNEKKTDSSPTGQ